MVMKTKSHFFFALLILFSCQKEETEIIDETQTPENIILDSPLAKLIARTSQNPTAVDNVLDNSSCFSVQLPVTVTVNSVVITVASTADYMLVKNAIDASNSDDDIVHFSYPITIRFKNFVTQVITNSNQFNAILNGCSDDGFDEIDCIAIVYPINVNVYNSNNQIANTIAIQNNTQLFNFIATLSNGIVATIEYPILVTNSNGINVVITNNSQLESFIDDAIDDCNDVVIGTNPTFTSILTTGTWRVSYFFEDYDETSYYTGYYFTFLANGTTTVVKNSITLNGTWSTYVDNNQNKLDLIYDGATLDEIEEDWRITEYTSTEIRLKDISGGNGGTKYLYLTKN